MPAAKKTTQPLNIYQRLLLAMEDVAYIKKEGKAPEKIGAYGFVKHDDVTAKVRPALIKHGIYLKTTVLKHSAEWLKDGYDKPFIFTTVEVEMTFINVDEPGNSVSATHWGYGIDRGDKGIGKAVSYAVKTGMLKGLCLETGEKDVEDSEIEVGKPREPSQGRPTKSKSDHPHQDTIDLVSKWSGVPQGVTKDERAKFRDVLHMSCIAAGQMHQAINSLSEANWGALGKYVPTAIQDGLVFADVTDWETVYGSPLFGGGES